VVTLNPDTELVDEGVDRLARFALEHGGLAGPRLLESDGSHQPSASGPVVGVWPWVGALVPGALQPPALRLRTEPWRLERTIEVAWLSGACIAGPRDLLLELGPFDPAIHLYGEDLDLGVRAAERGVVSYFCPDLCRVVHHGRGSTSKRWPEGPADAIEATWRAVVTRAYGPRREARAWRARKLHFALRAAGKRMTGRDASWDLALLAAARKAKPEQLPPAR
jgi:GT2 family glycosyltransferase